MNNDDDDDGKLDGAPNWWLMGKERRRNVVCVVHEVVAKNLLSAVVFKCHAFAGIRWWWWWCEPNDFLERSEALDSMILSINWYVMCVMLWLQSSQQCSATTMICFGLEDMSTRSPLQRQQHLNWLLHFTIRQASCGGGESLHLLTCGILRCMSSLWMKIRNNEPRSHPCYALANGYFHL